MGWDDESVESRIEVLLWGERKRSEVFTTFGGRSTVIESSFDGTILEMIQMPLFFSLNLFLGEAWRVRVFCGFVVLKGHPGGC